MEHQTARRIIDTLARGIHPVTGELMPPDSPYNDPLVIRALFTVSQSLDAPPAAPGVAVKTLRERTPPPVNAGKPWTPEDDAALEAGFDRGDDAKALADVLGRTRFGIEQRLIKLGKLPQPAGGGRFGAGAKMN